MPPTSSVLRVAQLAGRAEHPAPSLYRVRGRPELKPRRLRLRETFSPGRKGLPSGRSVTRVGTASNPDH
eukprot:29752-Amphidinium_carterae.1